jgi:hypothetical protein
MAIQNNVVTIFDALTGALVVREQTDTEKTQSLADEAEAEQRKQIIMDKYTAKQAVLEKLGITAEEAQLLLGGI